MAHNIITGGALVKKSIIVIFLATAIGLLPLASAMADEANFKAAAFIPKNHPLMSQTIVWAEMINKELAGQVKINYVGGPEVIPGMEQVEAVRKGVLDIAFVPTAYYENIIPEGAAFKRKPGGFYDYMVKRHEKIGTRYIGRVLWMPFYLWPKNEVKTLEDLKGIQMRTTALYDRFMTALGIVPVTIPAGDTYTALERGTVEGFGWPNIGPRERGWLEVVKNIIDLPFYGSNNVVIVMNLDKWNNLPKAVQDKIIAATAKFEPVMYNHFQKAVENEWTELDKIGIKRIKFSDAENKKYVDLAYQVKFEELAEKVPNLVSDLKRVSGN